MGVLDRFERGIERVVNGAFAKAFRSEVQPVEIASALRREADNRAAVVSRGRTLTANAYTVELSESDLERLSDLEQELSVDLRQVVGEHAASQGYSFVGPVTVVFEKASDLDTGMFRVRSTTKRPDGSSAAQPQDRGGYDPQSRANPVVPDPAPRTSHQPPGTSSPHAPPPGSLGVPRRPRQNEGAPPAAHATPRTASARGVYIGSQFHPLRSGSTVFGRSEASADIILADSGCSRRHFEITVDGDRAIATDLGSTNGTKLGGRRISSVVLKDGDVLTAGSVSIQYHDPGARG